MRLPLALSAVLIAPVAVLAQSTGGGVPGPNSGGTGSGVVANNCPTGMYATGQSSSGIFTCSVVPLTMQSSTYSARPLNLPAYALLTITDGVTATACTTGGGTASIVCQSNGDGTFHPIAGSGSGNGTVTSVAGVAPVSGNVPLNASNVGAIPADGSTVIPVAQIPSLPSTKITGLGTAATANTGTANGAVPLIGVNNVLPLALLCQGTAAAGYYCDGVTGAWASVVSQVPSGTATGQYVVNSGTNTIAQNTTGTAANITGVLDASKITTGTLAPARLPAVSTSQAGIVTQLPGTTTTFLRGDGTFAAIPGGATIASTTLLLKGDNAGNALAAVPGTDYPTVTSVTTAQNTANTALSQSNSAAQGGFALTDLSHLIAFYPFKETSGTTLTDTSGNGNSGTIQISPTLTGVGYQFTADNQYVSLPVALNAANTYYFAVNFKPGLVGQLGGDNNNQTCVLCGNTSQNAANHFMITSRAPNAGTFATTAIAMVGTYSLQVVVGNQYTNVTWTPDVFAGTHVVAVACPSAATPLIYLDGQLLANTATGPSCYNVLNGVTATNLQLGADAGGYYATNLTYQESAFFTTVHTAQQIAINSAALKQALLNKGALTIAQQPYLYPTPNIIVTGDSIACGFYIAGSGTTCGVGATDSRAAANVMKNYLNNQTFTVYDYGVPFASLETNLVAAPQYYSPLCNSGFGQSYLIQEGGTNTFTYSLTSLTAAQVSVQALAKQNSLASIVGVGGCQSVLQTLVSRSGNYPGSGGGTYDAVLQADSSYKRSNWRNTKFAALVDLGTDPYFGVIGAYSNPYATGTCTQNTSVVGCAFLSDQLHVSVWGQDRVAQAYAKVINGLQGSGPDSMNTTIISAASTTLAVADGGRSFSPTQAGANQTAALFSAQWITGRRVKYCNIDATTATNSLMITAPADAPFNNIAGTTALTILPSSCATLEATFNENVAAPAGYWKVIK